MMWNSLWGFLRSIEFIGQYKTFPSEALNHYSFTRSTHAYFKINTDFKVGLQTSYL